MVLFAEIFCAQVLAMIFLVSFKIAPHLVHQFIATKLQWRVLSQTPSRCAFFQSPNTYQKVLIGVCLAEDRPMPKLTKI